MAAKLTKDKILIVNDGPVILKAMANLIPVAFPGMSALTAPDVQTAEEILQQDQQDKRIALVIVDARLPYKIGAAGEEGMVKGDVGRAFCDNHHGEIKVILYTGGQIDGNEPYPCVISSDDFEVLELTIRDCLGEKLKPAEVAMLQEVHGRHVSQSIDVTKATRRETPLASGSGLTPHEIDDDAYVRLLKQRAHQRDNNPVK